MASVIGSSDLERQIRAVGAARETALKVTMEAVERISPRVALILHIALQDGERHRLAALPAKFDPAGKRRRVRKPHFFRQEASDFQIGIDALDEAPKNFQNEPVAEDDRAVRLLTLHRHRLERRLGGARDLRE